MGAGGPSRRSPVAITRSGRQVTPRSRDFGLDSDDRVSFVASVRYARAETPAPVQGSSEQGRRRALGRLLRFVHLDNERMVEPACQDGSFAEMQQSHRALVIFVRSAHEFSGDIGSRSPMQSRRSLVLPSAPLQVRRDRRRETRSARKAGLISAPTFGYKASAPERRGVSG